jgi:hypothetical protein
MKDLLGQREQSGASRPVGRDGQEALARGAPVSSGDQRPGVNIGAWRDRNSAVDERQDDAPKAQARSQQALYARPRTRLAAYALEHDDPTTVPVAADDQGLVSVSVHGRWWVPWPQARGRVGVEWARSTKGMP